LPTLLQGTFDCIKGTCDPAAGLASALLVKLVKRGNRGFRFHSEKQARCHKDVALLLDLGLAAWEENKQRKGGVVRLSESVQRTFGIRH